MLNCVFTGCLSEAVAICSCENKVALCKDHLILHMIQCEKQINPIQDKNRKRILNAKNKLYLLQRNLIDISCKMYKIIQQNFMNAYNQTCHLMGSLINSTNKSKSIQEECLKEAEMFEFVIGSLEDFKIAVQEILGILPEEQRMLSAKEQRLKIDLLYSEIGKLRETISQKEREIDNCLKDCTYITGKLEFYKNKYLEKEKENDDLIIRLQNNAETIAKLKFFKEKYLEKENDLSNPDAKIKEINDQFDKLTENLKKNNQDIIERDEEIKRLEQTIDQQLNYFEQEILMKDELIKRNYQKLNQSVKECKILRIKLKNSLKSPQYTSKGLKNLHNSSYINSVLQTLVHLDNFIDEGFSTPLNRALFDLASTMRSKQNIQAQLDLKQKKFYELLSEEHCFKNGKEEIPNYLLIYLQKSLCDEERPNLNLIRWTKEVVFEHFIDYDKIHRTECPEQVTNIFFIKPENKFIKKSDFSCVLAQYLKASESRQDFCSHCKKFVDGNEEVKSIDKGDYIVFCTVRNGHSCRLNEITEFSVGLDTLTLAVIIVLQKVINDSTHKFAICKEDENWVVYNDSKVSVLDSNEIDDVYIFVFKVTT